MDSTSKKRKSNYSGYKHNQRSRPILLPGLKGFLCTCNFREKECIRESYNLLNEYADRLYGNDKTVTPESVGDTSANAEEDSEDTEDIQSTLSKELESLKSEGNKKIEQRKFQVVESGAKNCLFIRTTVESPTALVSYIVKDLEDNKKQKTRFLLRLLPIETTCKAYLEDILEFADPILDQYFVKEGKTFSILFNCRSNKSVNREKVIDSLATLVLGKNAGNVVNLKQPQLSVLIEIIRNICCISVLPDYYRFRRYNLLEITGQGENVDASESVKLDKDGEDVNKHDPVNLEANDIEGQE